jgi:hypothetical protein
VEYRAVFWSLPVMAAYTAAYMAARKAAYKAAYMAAYSDAYSDAYRPHSGSLYCLTVLKTINGC